MPGMEEVRQVWDAGGDVLYVSLKGRQIAHHRELADDFETVLQLDADDQIIGVTILGLSKLDHCPGGEHLPPAVRKAVEAKIREERMSSTEIRNALTTHLNLIASDDETAIESIECLGRDLASMSEAFQALSLFIENDMSQEVGQLPVPMRGQLHKLMEEIARKFGRMSGAPEVFVRQDDVWVQVDETPTLDAPMNVDPVAVDGLDGEWNLYLSGGRVYAVGVVS